MYTSSLGIKSLLQLAMGQCGCIVGGGGVALLSGCRHDGTNSHFLFMHVQHEWLHSDCSVFVIACSSHTIVTVTVIFWMFSVVLVNACTMHMIEICMKLASK